MTKDKREPAIYDIGTDTYRPVTQDDVDRLMMASGIGADVRAIMRFLAQPTSTPWRRRVQELRELADKPL
jgi:hypothetical protein